MSNNTNLSKLANVLDDGSSGQFLKSTGSGGVVFDAVAAGTTTVADITALEALSAAQGDMAFVLSNDNVYIRKTAGWYKIAQVTNNQLESVTVTMSGGGTAGDPYALALDGTNTTATGAATDPEGLSVTWSAAAISPTTLSGNNIVVSSVNVATITQGTGASSNVFTIDPTATTGTHNFSLRFSVTDGINAALSADKDYILNFVTVVADSRYTVMLAQAVGANNTVNSAIADSSSSSHTITNTGTPVAGTFSPYRGRGYSGYFPDTGGNAFVVSSHADFAMGTGAFTVSMWVKMAHTYGGWIFDTRDGSNAGLAVQASGSQFIAQRNTSSTTVSATLLNTWGHFCWTRDGSGNNKLFLNGVQSGSTFSDTTNYTSQNFKMGESHTGGDDLKGWVKDIHIVKGYAYEPTAAEILGVAEVKTGTVFLGCALPYIGDKSSSPKTITTSNGFILSTDSPNDYPEYGATDNGGSVYFDRASYNSGSCITVADHNDFTLGTSDWTVKFWVYHDELNASSNNAYGYFSNYYYNTPGGFGLKWMNQHGNKPVLEYMNSGAYAKKIFDFVPSAKIWYYYELTCSSSTVTFKVNGETIGTQSVPDLGNPNRTLIVGAASNGSSGVENFLGGYIADFQYVIGGTASESSVPTAPMSTDSNAALHIKGTDGSIIDKSSSANLELAGDAKCTTTAVVYNSTTISSKSILFDGTGDKISLGNLLHFGDNNSVFSLEMWAKFDTLSHSTGYLTVFGDDDGNYGKFWFGVRNNKLAYKIDSNVLQSGSATLSTNTWYHLAFVRSGLNTGHTAYPSTRTFVNGTLDQTDSSWKSPYTFPDLPAYLGAASSEQGNMDGYIQDFRFQKHYVGWTESSGTYTYPVPTEELKG